MLAFSGLKFQTERNLNILSKSLLLEVLERFAMGATEEALQNLVNVNVVDDAENPKNIKVSGTEDSVVNDKELGAKETPIKDKKDSIPGEVKEMLKSLASEWENVVDINALQVIPLKGAMTNEVFQIKWQTTAGESSRKVLLRTYGEGTGIFFDRDVEVTTFEFMSKSGQGPSLLGRFANGRIEEFINARVMSSLYFSILFIVIFL